MKDIIETITILKDMGYNDITKHIIRFIDCVEEINNIKNLVNKPNFLRIAGQRRARLYMDTHYSYNCYWNTRNNSEFAKLHDTLFEGSFLYDDAPGPTTMKDVDIKSINNESNGH